VYVAYRTSARQEPASSKDWHVKIVHEFVQTARKDAVA
jgi:hypothetical protein